MDDDKEITAVFEKEEYKLTIEWEGDSQSQRDHNDHG